MKKTIAGHTLDLVTISQLGKMCGRKASTIRKWEFTGLIPEANFRSPDVPLANGETRKGFRLYSMNLAVKFSEIVREEMVQGIKTEESTLNKINKLFQEEREKFGG